MGWLTPNWSTKCQSFFGFFFKQYKLYFGCTCSIKKVNKYKLKFKTKPWITPALQKSISIKNKLLKKFITAKDPQIKERCHKEYKDYRNMLSTIFKQTKTNTSFNHYFVANWNSIKNTWKGLKSILNIKNTSADIHKTLTVDGTTI